MCCSDPLPQNSSPHAQEVPRIRVTCGAAEEICSGPGGGFCWAGGGALRPPPLASCSIAFEDLASLFQPLLQDEAHSSVRVGSRRCHVHHV